MSKSKPKRFYMECGERTAKKIRILAEKRNNTTKAQLDKIVSEFLNEPSEEK